MMCGLLLARAGIDVWVLEKHKDFLRDFRGDTVHPSTLRLMDELGLLDKFLARPHTEVRVMTAEFGRESFRVADFERLRGRAKFTALMPQWDFLDFLAEEARRYPSFHIAMEAEVTELMAKGNRIVGVRVKTPEGAGDLLAKLVIGADGRHSTVRDKAKLKVVDIGAPFDVLWLRLPFAAGDPKEPVARFVGGGFFVMLYRGDYWQCAMVIAKGGYDTIKAEGLSGFQARLRTAAGFARDRAETVTSFDQVHLLTVKVDRLEKWARRGLLCIGDAAHAMSPVGGVGINLAIQDAVAAANILAATLKKRTPSVHELARVQKRREWPTRVVQRFQVIAQNQVLARTIRSQVTPKPPWPLYVLDRWGWLRQWPARFLGIGMRPEHVRTPAVLLEPRLPELKTGDSAPT
ncbi:MAG: FAD-dependent oxidoreductase [Alphaproteobacteria bacterium]|nr:FAD-dependent oxidoreductase [Alphaproteobacteria bacterium]MBL6939780.1 FAD-dependent oxidoreductase [Alphaproteobacteria bacterium]MBL7098233.1 FAD-dependent oxidoreductase [Alphaproteobacteria bacterium]